MHNRDNYITRPIDIQKELLMLLNKESVKIVFDIGACEAEDSIRYSMLFPNSKIYAFEPRKDNLITANEFIINYKCSNIILENIALSNTNGEAEFFLSEGQPSETTNKAEWDYGNKSSSLLKPTRKLKKHVSWLQFNNKIKVKTLRLDTYMESNLISEIDFLHIDVQGAELMVFEGAGKFLSKMKIIWMEVEAVELYKKQPLKNEIEKFMKKNKFFNILDTVNDISGDQLYVNSFYFSEQEVNKLKIKS